MIGIILPVLFAAAAALSPAGGVGARMLPRTTRVSASVGELQDQDSGTQASAALSELVAGDTSARLRGLLALNDGAIS